MRTLERYEEEFVIEPRARIMTKQPTTRSETRVRNFPTRGSLKQAARVLLKIAVSPREFSISRAENFLLRDIFLERRGTTSDCKATCRDRRRIYDSRAHQREEISSRA